MKLFIYALKDPRTDEVMYIGCSNNPKKRLASHLCKSHLTHRTSKRVVWIKELLFLALKPVLQVLEEVSETNAKDREVYWMKHFKHINPDLTNIDLHNCNNRQYGDRLLKKYQPRPRVDLEKELTVSNLMEKYGCNKKMAKFIIKCHSIEIEVDNE
ncbi:hypothetical protein LCGC14_1722350 [marine sediment metagenome]|uniref:GIY-YIG domain-containing protein n=1 Tax=marine sediment metagenome TaxID=412755 RepID=A0A0F9HZR0_9ZZZZ